MGIKFSLYFCFEKFYYPFLWDKFHNFFYIKDNILVPRTIDFPFSYCLDGYAY